MSSLGIKAKRSLAIQMERLEEQKREAEILSKSKLPKIKNFFLPYQKKWILDNDLFVLMEKARRTGITFATSYKAIDAVKRDKMDVYYSTYNLPACAEFMRYCAKWLRAFNLLSKTYYNIEIVNEANITNYKIVLNNGRRIEAIAGNPVNLRGKDNAIIIIDEFAFRIAEVAEILKAVMAIIMQQKSQILALSTHNGEDHEFNQICQKMVKKELKGSHHKIDFRQAVKEGYYKQICLFNGKIWTPEAEKKYVDEVYEYYGEGASEELDVIPRKYSQGHVFKYEHFKVVPIDEYQLYKTYQIRYFDLASTINKNSFFSATVKVGIFNEVLIILDAQAEKLEALAGDEWIRDIIISDTRYPVVNLIEQEGGASGDKYVQGMINSMPNHYIEGYHPSKDKIRRALPVANAVKRTKVLIADRQFYINGNWITPQQLIEIFCRFTSKPEPLVTDLTDCLSGCYDYAVNHSGQYSDSIESFSSIDEDILAQMIIN